MEVTLECKKRPEGAKPRALRREGLIPAALYGHNGTESVSLIVKEKDALNLLKSASVNNTLVDVNVPEMPWNGKAIIREVQAHPWKRTLYHLSFFSVAAHGKIEVVVPLKLAGQSPAVKQGGIIEQMVTEVNVECTADIIPESIEVDMSSVAMGTSVSVGDLVLPAGVVCKDDPNKVILSIMAPKKGGGEAA